MSDSKRRVLLVQYGGDYLAADRLLRSTGDEAYYGHRYVLSMLEAIVPDVDAIGILCCRSDTRYFEALESGVWVLGAAADPRRSLLRVLKVIRRFRPTHLVLLSPLYGVLTFALLRRMRVLFMLADSVDRSDLKGQVLRIVTRLSLNARAVRWVANHGVNACASLLRAGVRDEKLIAWDWPQAEPPEPSEAKSVVPEGVVQLMYAGSVIEQKGVDDLLVALRALITSGVDARCLLAGAGDVERFRARAAELGVAERVEFVGVIPNRMIVPLMREATLVVVPSRHEYPEGFPLTIYEALRAQTPIVASDHPMFRGFLTQGETAMIFEAGDATALARAVTDVTSSDELYAKLSQASAGLLQSLLGSALWGDILTRWLNGSAEDERWLTGQSQRTRAAMRSHSATQGAKERGAERPK